MGRCFSTVYRYILVVVGISALTLTILSATSCSFVKFDHQYKSERQLLFPDAKRALQTEGTEADADGATDPATETPADGTPADGTPADDTTPAATPVEAPAESPADDATPATPDDAPAEAPADAPTDDGTTPILGETQGTTVAEGSPEIYESGTTPVAGPNLSAPAPVGNPISNSLPTSSNPFPYAPAAEDVKKKQQQEEGGGDEDEEGDDEKNDEEEEEGPYGASDASAKAAVSPEAVAAVSGNAGLWCDGEASFSITNLWGGSLKDLEDSIAEESNNDQSEEIARNAAVSASVFGAFALVILLFESIVGWRMCLDRWIVGLVSMMACISQGVTFLFFNSDRYCDGDIVHEILNQEPCVVGQGATFSIIALVLYFLMMVASCRLPQDDPFGLCCKKKDSGKSSTSSGASASNGSANGSGKFGLLGGKADTNGSDDMSASDQKPERPNWLSEEGKKDSEESEII